MTAAEIKVVNDLRSRRDALMALQRSEGWQLFVNVFKTSESAAYDKALQADNAHDMAKHLGAYHALRCVNTWIEREMQAISVQVSSLSDSPGLK